MSQLNFQWIEAFQLRDHYFLTEEDTCFFLGDYMPGKGLNGPLNQLIYNLKIKPSERTANPSRWCYKEQAIQKVANI